MKLGVKKVVNALRKKPLSFLITSNGVTPIKGSNTQDLSGTLAGGRSAGSEL
jgi:putative transposase